MVSRAKQPPPPPQHVPRLQARPQLSTPVPQHSLQVPFEVQPHTLATPAPSHVSGFAHAPQSRIAPQPSLTVPQFFPSSAQVFGTHASDPHLFGPPPPHVGVDASQVPHAY